MTELGKYDVRAFRTFCEDIIYNIKRESKIIKVRLRNKRMKYVMVDLDLGDMVYTANKTYLIIEKADKCYRYFLNIDGRKINLNLSTIEKRLIWKTLNLVKER